MNVIMKIYSGGQIRIMEIPPQAITNFKRTDKTPSKSTMWQFKVKSQGWKKVTDNKKIVMHCADIAHDLLGRPAVKDEDFVIEIED